MAVFALTMDCGPDWDAALPRREQQAWDEHAAFMDALTEDGFIILGGPLGDGEHTMLVVEAEDEREVRARLAADPWAELRLLAIGSLQPWSIWLDGRAVQRVSR